jgi:hypothetical protein
MISTVFLVLINYLGVVEILRYKYFIISSLLYKFIMVILKSFSLKFLYNFIVTSFMSFPLVSKELGWKLKNKKLFMKE